MGKNFQYLSVNAIHESLGESKARALPMFHAFSGCDTTSSFQGRGKKRAWEAWNAYPELSQTFQDVSSNKFKNMAIDSAAFKVVERFVVILYGKNSSAASVNTARRELFTKKARTLETFRPQR